MEIQRWRVREKDILIQCDRGMKGDGQSVEVTDRKYEEMYMQKKKEIVRVRWREGEGLREIQREKTGEERERMKGESHI